MIDDKRDRPSGSGAPSNDAKLVDDVTEQLFSALDPARADRVDRGALHALLAERLVRARERHPRLAPPVQAIAESYLRAIGGSDDPVAAIDRARTDDLYLVAALGSGDAAAVAAFEAEAIEPLGRALGHLQISASHIDDIKQTVRTKLLVASGEEAPRIREYAGRGDLRSWVSVIATREALSSLRRTRKESTPAEDVLMALPSPLTGPELGFLKEHYRDEFRAAFTSALGELSARDRNVLRHHYVHGLTIDEIGAMYGLHRSNAARRIAKARDLLLSTTRRRLVLGLNVDRVEFESIMRMIESRIDVSIQRLLGSDDGETPT